MNMTEDSWGACISIACSRDFVRLALAAVEKMLNMGITPSSRTVSTVLGLCQKQNRYRDAVKIYDRKSLNGAWCSRNRWGGIRVVELSPSVSLITPTNQPFLLMWLCVLMGGSSLLPWFITVMKAKGIRPDGPVYW